MACKHTDINCGCKNSFLTTPPPCPTPDDCPDPQPCSEVFDAQCIVYTGPQLNCVGCESDNQIVVDTHTNMNEILESLVSYFCQRLNLEKDLNCGETTIAEIGTCYTEALQNVVGYFCNNQVQCCPTFAVDINFNEGEVGTLSTTLTNGTAPFTYQWTIEQNEFTGFSIAGATNGSSINLNLVNNTYIATEGGTSGDVRSCLFKVTVTDANGQIASAYYNAVRFTGAQ